MNKKIIIIIIATILALVLACIVVKKPQSNEVIAPEVKKESVENADTGSGEEVEEVEEIKKEPEAVSVKTKQAVIRKTKMQKKVIQKTESVQKNAEELTVVQEAEIKITEPAEEQKLIIDEGNGNITVLKEFRSDNLFKLKYTPIRFRKNLK